MNQSLLFDQCTVHLSPTTTAPSGTTNSDRMDEGCAPKSDSDLDSIFEGGECDPIPPAKPMTTSGDMVEVHITDSCECLNPNRHITVTFEELS